MKEIDNHPIVLDGKIFHWISLELLVDNEGLGTIGLLSEEEKINEDGYLLLEIAGNVCEYEIERLVAVEKEQNKQKSLFMEQILSGNLPVYEVAKERAQIHQWDLQPETTVILIDPIDLDAGLLQRVISLLQRYLSDMDLKNHPISSVESHIIMLLPQKEFTQPKMLSDLHNFLLRKDIPTRICVGSQVPFRHLNKSYADSRQALLLAGYQDRPICYFQKLGVYRLLNHPFSKMVILEFHNQYVEPILAFDKRHHADLYETILAYFQAGGNYAKTGAALYVHANTIRYRISTIEKVCKLNLSEEDDRLSLELALRLSPFLEIPSD
jgi:sugar diacid utilization regulator